MKRLFYVILTLVIFLLGGCSNTPIRTELLTNNKNLVKIEVVQEKSGLLDKGIGLIIENLTNEVLEIDWNSSSLDGDSVIISGQLYSQRNTLLPKTVLAPHSKTTKSINKTSNIDDFWVEGGEKALELPAKLVLHVTVKDKEEYVILNLIEKIK